MASLAGIFLIFIGLLVYGAVLPQTFTFEESVPVDADTDDLYDQISEMTHIRTWGPYVSGLGLDETALTGAERGSGQIIDWRRSLPPFEVGTQKILAMTPPYYVQGEFLSTPYNGSFIYALNEGLPTDKVTVLVRIDLDTGGFPFFKRVKLRLKKQAVHNELSQSLSRLKTISER